MSSDPEDLDVLTSEGITELFGWPVTLLDEMRELRDLAYSGKIGIEEWRRRDEELRVVGPSQFPRDRIQAVYDAALDTCFDRRRRGEEVRDGIQRLIGRLAAARRAR